MAALAPDAWEEVCRRRHQGETIASLAQAFGLRAATLGKKFASQGIAPKSKARARPKVKSAPKSKSGGAEVKPTARAHDAAPRDADAPEAASKTKSARPRPARATPERIVRRQLIGRLYRAIDTKLKLMERRMNSEIDALDAGGDPTASPPSDAAVRTSADHERETRAFGALVKTINSVRQMQAELDTLANAHTASAAAKPSAADARLAADAERYRRDIAERLAKFVPPQS